MTTLYIVGCGAVKLPHAAPAASLYTGCLFRDARAHVEAEIARTGGAWRILSARHGLIRPDLWLAPYDYTLTELLREVGRAGAVEDLRDRLAAILTAATCRRVEVHAGALYAELLREAADGLAEFIDPLRGREIGMRRQWYAHRRNNRSGRVDGVTVGG